LFALVFQIDYMMLINAFTSTFSACDKIPNKIETKFWNLRVRD